MVMTLQIGQSKTNDQPNASSKNQNSKTKKIQIFLLVNTFKQ